VAACCRAPGTNPWRQCITSAATLQVKEYGRARLRSKEFPMKKAELAQHYPWDYMALAQY
jgi:hypothetical protein